MYFNFDFEQKLQSQKLADPLIRLFDGNTVKKNPTFLSREGAKPNEICLGPIPLTFGAQSSGYRV
jgi:hypothetical protein